MGWLPAKDVLERIKLCVEILAFVLAGTFLLLRVVIPWFSNTSAEVEVRTKRDRSDSPDKDYLAIEVRLRRHGISQCDLRSITAQVRNPFSSEEAQTVPFDVNGVKATTDGVDFNALRPKPEITLDPDDALHFSKIIRVPSESTQIVDAVIVCGRVTTGSQPEWRSSTASLPSDGTRKADAGTPKGSE